MCDTIYKRLPRAKNKDRGAVVITHYLGKSQSEIHSEFFQINDAAL